MDSTKQIEQCASDWLRRREGSDWTAADEAALAAWLEQSTAHRVAYLRLKTGWGAMDRLKALGAGFARGSVPAPEHIDPNWRPLSTRPPSKTSLPETGDRAGRADSGVRQSKSYKRPVFALSASILIVCMAGYMSWDHLRVARYSTPVGVTAAVPLPDGSKITLNTDSEIRLAVNERERKVELSQGEAYFEVTPDPARPFVVRAGDKRIVVLGTKFSVKRDREDIRVVVTEGKVRIEGAGLSTKESVLVAGAVAEAGKEAISVQQQALLKVEQLLTWRAGYLVFEETRLADAVAEFNRYSPQRIRITDPAVAEIRISGKFRSANFESFARLLQESHQIAAHRSGDTIVLSPEAAVP